MADSPNLTGSSLPHSRKRKSEMPPSTRSTKRKLNATEEDETMENAYKPAVESGPSKRTRPPSGRAKRVVNYAATADLTRDEKAGTPSVTAPPKTRRTRQPKKTPPQFVNDRERRLKEFRYAAPDGFAAYYERAMTDRLFALSRIRTVKDDLPSGVPECPMETVELAGSTGNIYTVTINSIPRCTCPNFYRGNPLCKHIIYVLVKVLKAPEHLQYQLAFLTSELHEIFAKAGPLPVETIGEEDKDGKRKPIEGDCAICCCELEADSEEIVWCRAACGNNLHKACFDQWVNAKRGGNVTCPFCRTTWQNEVVASPTQIALLKNIDRSGEKNHEGFVNIGEQLGLSGRRNYSRRPLDASHNLD